MNRLSEQQIRLDCLRIAAPRYQPRLVMPQLNSYGGNQTNFTPPLTELLAEAKALADFVIGEKPAAKPKAKARRPARRR